MFPTDTDFESNMNEFINLSNSRFLQHIDFRCAIFAAQILLRHVISITSNNYAVSTRLRSLTYSDKSAVWHTHTQTAILDVNKILAMSRHSHKVQNIRHTADGF